MTNLYESLHLPEMDMWVWNKCHFFLVTLFSADRIFPEGCGKLCSWAFAIFLIIQAEIPEPYGWFWPGAVIELGCIIAAGFSNQPWEIWPTGDAEVPVSPTLNEVRQFSSYSSTFCCSQTEDGGRRILTQLHNNFCLSMSGIKWPALLGNGPATWKER